MIQNVLKFKSKEQYLLLIPISTTSPIPPIRFSAMNNHKNHHYYPTVHQR